jgi:ribosomal-protein-serine acetyltransferase
MDLRDLRIDVDERLAVRMWEPADAPALYERVVANRSYIGEWLPWPSSYASVAVAEAFIEGARSRASERAGWDAGIFFEGAPIGGTSFERWEERFGVAEIGYWLAEEHGGGGVMTRCTRSVVTAGFAELGLHRIEIRVDALNGRSRAVAERLGFTLEGTLREDLPAAGTVGAGGRRDTVVYAMLAREWEAR